MPLKAKKSRGKKSTTRKAKSKKTRIAFAKYSSVRDTLKRKGRRLVHGYETAPRKSRSK